MTGVLDTMTPKMARSQGPEDLFPHSRGREPIKGEETLERGAIALLVTPILTFPHQGEGTFEIVSYW